MSESGILGTETGLIPIWPDSVGIIALASVGRGLVVKCATTWTWASGTESLGIILCPKVNETRKSKEKHLIMIPGSGILCLLKR
jgi:hypothetical protein